MEIDPAELVTQAGAGRLLGLSRQRVAQLADSRRSGFPDPALVIDGLRIYERRAVLAWAAARRSRIRNRRPLPAVSAGTDRGQL